MQWYKRRVHGDSRQLDLSLKSSIVNHARNMAKLFVILALAALASAAPVEDAPASIDLKKIQKVEISDLKGKFFGGGLGLGGYGLGGGDGYNNAYNRNHYQNFHHQQQSSSTSYNSGSNLGYYGAGYNRFYRADGSLVTDEKEIKEFAASFIPKDNVDAAITSD